MSLYAEYIEEREGKNILERHEGFATYSYAEDSVYIENIYVRKEFRKSGIAADMADTIALIAKVKGIKKMYGSVCPTANGSTESMKALLAYGFKLDSAANNFIVFKKEINNG